MNKITLSADQILAAMDAAGMVIDHVAYDAAIAAAIKKLADEIDAEILRKLKAALPRVSYEEVENSAALWEKLKYLDSYEDSSGTHVSESRYELDGVKYAAMWEIWGTSDIPVIMRIIELNNV